MPDVLVVGSGPVGLTPAPELARHLLAALAAFHAQS